MKSLKELAREEHDQSKHVGKGMDVKSLREMDLCEDD